MLMTSGQQRRWRKRMGRRWVKGKGLGSDVVLEDGDRKGRKEEGGS